MKRSLLRLFASLLLPIPLLAADEPGITRKQAEDILKELQQIRQLLQSGSNPRGGQRPPMGSQAAVISLKLEKPFFILGSESAPLTVVEFTDYQCPFCQQFHTTTFNDLKRDYIDTGMVRFYSRDFPLVEVHKDALRAAQAARCAAEEGKFWEMRDALQSNPQKLELEAVLDHARDLKLDVDRVRECIASEKYRKAVEGDAAEGVRIGINGTPAFVVGTSTPEGVDGQLVMGALPYPMFDQKLRELRAK